MSSYGIRNEDKDSIHGKYNCNRWILTHRDNRRMQGGRRQAWPIPHADTDSTPHGSWCWWGRKDLAHSSLDGCGTCPGIHTQHQHYKILVQNLQIIHISRLCLTRIDTWLTWDVTKVLTFSMEKHCLVILESQFNSLVHRGKVILSMALFLSTQCYREQQADGS